MNAVEMFTLLQEISAVYKELQDDGTIAKIVAAEEAIKHQLESNSKLQHLHARLESLVQKLAAQKHAELLQQQIQQQLGGQPPKTA